MNPVLRMLMLAAMLIASTVIGWRVYLELSHDHTEGYEAEGIGAADVVIEQLPQFTLNDMWGEPTSIDKWAGQPLLINFWATWCAPCLREMPLLQTLHNEQAATGLTVIGIALDREPDVQRFITENGISYPILVGQEAVIEISDQFGNAGGALPFTVLAAADGNILAIYAGELVREQLTTFAEVSRAYAAGETNIAAARERLRAL